VTNLRIFRFAIICNNMGKLVANNVPSRVRRNNALAGLAITPIVRLASARRHASRRVGTSCMLIATTVLRQARVDSHAFFCRGGLLVKTADTFAVKGTGPTVETALVLSTGCNGPLFRAMINCSAQFLAVALETFLAEALGLRS